MKNGNLAFLGDLNLVNGIFDTFNWSAILITFILVLGFFSEMVSYMGGYPGSLFHWIRSCGTESLSSRLQVSMPKLGEVEWISNSMKRNSFFSVSKLKGEKMQPF